MQLHSFPGGLALPHHKQTSLAHPLQRCPLPPALYVPVGQHQGEAGRILVEPGQSVRAGQPLTLAEDDYQVPAHAPCAGTVVGLVQRPASFPPESYRRCIEMVPADEAFSQWDDEPGRRLPDWRRCNPTELVDHLRAMGLAGLGGAMFPTAAKLRGDWPTIDTLILNGVECEPWIACDEALMRSRPEDILGGGLVLAAAVVAERIVVAVEDPMKQTAQALERAAERLGIAERVEVVRVPAVYPQGGERQLIQTLTGLEVPHDGLPQDIGLLCHNVATAAAAFDAVEHGRPLTERIVTVTGPGVSQPRNLIAAIGTPLSWLIRQAGGYTEHARRLILGGPMSGTALTTDEVALTKGSNCVLVLDTPPAEPATSMPCINCGFCVESCPARLLPQLIYRAVAAEDYDQAAELAVGDCIECGVCARVCPSQIPLVDYYRHAKGEIGLRALDQRRAALARRRHEARQERLAAEQAARARRRQARAEKLREKSAAADEIQAAIARASQRKKSTP